MTLIQSTQTLCFRSPSFTSFHSSSSFTFIHPSHLGVDYLISHNEISVSLTTLSTTTKKKNRDVQTGGVRESSGSTSSVEQKRKSKWQKEDCGCAYIITSDSAQRSSRKEKFHVSSDTSEFLVRASYCEIYNENVRDLLSTNTKRSLQLKQHPERGVYVKD